MSKRSQAKRSGNIAKQLTFFAAGFPVNPQASPESEKEPPIIAGSGLTFCAWCLKSTPCGCWRRTLAECLAWTLRECNSANGLRVSLELSATNSCPSSWLLKTLAHRTEENESSSSGDAWMTPDASDWKQDGLEASKRRLEKYSTISLNAQAWPTPTVCGNNNRAELSPKAGNGLATEVKAWPTPTTIDAGAGRINRSASPNAVDRPTLALLLRDGQADPDNPSTDGKSRALLNPRWVAQLQGFPSDWLDGIEWPL